MSRRASIAVAVLLLWLGGMGVLVSKEYFRPRFDELAIAASRVNPGAVYFAIFQDSVQTGFASSIVDTTTTEIIASDNMVLDPITTGGSQRSLTKSRVVMSRGLRVQSFETSTEARGSTIHVTGVIRGDSLVVTRTGLGKAPDSARFAVTGPVFLPTILPLVIPLAKPIKVGVTYALPMFDPVTLALTNATFAVTAESLFVVPDSATFDPATKRWRAILPDTVRAWRITPVSGPSFSGWIDGEGQMIQTVRLGVELHRLPYEVAFENWKAASDARALLPGKR